MQKQSSEHIPCPYRPYDFPSDFPVYAFLGDFWKTYITKPEFFHFHNAIEIGHCIDGNGMLYYNDKLLSCTTGDFNIIFPQIPHICVATEASVSWEYIYVDVKTLLENKAPYSDQLWQIFYIPQRIPPIIGREGSVTLRYYLDRLFKEFHEKRPLYREAVISLLISLFAELNRITLDTGLISHSESEGTVSYIRRSLSYIYEHYNEPISVSSLASYCRISESHFRRIFKTIVGISPLEYIQHYRIQQACHYLARRELSVSSIAHQVGFTTLSSFNRQFLQYMNISPTAWQKAHSASISSHEILSYEESETKNIFRI